MNTVYWAPPVQSQTQIPVFHAQMVYSLPTFDSMDWALVDSIDPEILSTTNDTKTLSHLMRVFLDATTFVTDSPQRIGKLLQLLQILIENLRMKNIKYRASYESISKENSMLKKELNRIKKRNSQICPVCNKRVKNISALDAHFFKSHPNLSAVWKSLRTPHENGVAEFQELANTLRPFATDKPNKDDSLKRVIRRIGRKVDRVEDQFLDLKTTIGNGLLATAPTQIKYNSRKNLSHDEKDNVYSFSYKSDSEKCEKPTKRKQTADVIMKNDESTKKAINKKEKTIQNAKQPKEIQEKSKRKTKKIKETKQNNEQRKMSKETQKSAPVDKEFEEKPKQIEKKLQNDKSSDKLKLGDQENSKEIKAPKQVEKPKEQPPQKISKLQVEVPSDHRFELSEPEIKEVPNQEKSHSSFRKSNSDNSFEDFHNTPAMRVRHTDSMEDGDQFMDPPGPMVSEASQDEHYSIRNGQHFVSEDEYYQDHQSVGGKSNGYNDDIFNVPSDQIDEDDLNATFPTGFNVPEDDSYENEYMLKRSFPQRRHTVEMDDDFDPTPTTPPRILNKRVIKESQPAPTRRLPYQPSESKYQSVPPSPTADYTYDDHFDDNQTKSPDTPQSRQSLSQRYGKQYLSTVPDDDFEFDQGSDDMAVTATHTVKIDNDDNFINDWAQPGENGHEVMGVTSSEASPTKSFQQESWKPQAKIDPAFDAIPEEGSYDDEFHMDYDDDGYY